MNQRLQALGAVLRKDLQLFWLIAALTATLNVLANVSAIVTQTEVMGGLVVGASLLATTLLIVLVFHEDSAVSGKRGWLTRPVPGMTILAAKCIFVLLFVLLPGMLGNVLDGFYVGRPPVSVLASGMAEGFSGAALSWVVWTMVLAALTSGIRQAIGAFLLCIVMLVLALFFAWPVSGLMDTADSGAGGISIGAQTLEWLATLAALPVLWILYRRRHGRRDAFVLVVMAVMAGGTWLFTAAHTDASSLERERLMKITRGDLDAASGELERFYALNQAAMNALKDGNVAKATTLANELAQLALKYPNDWNYGNAIQDANQVLGRIALANGDVAEASRRLLASADSKGSPQMNSFGPNMQLAKDLLEKGEPEVVIEYFNRCSSFWKMGRKELASWTSSVRSGKIPDFGANLNY